MKTVAPLLALVLLVGALAFNAHAGTHPQHVRHHWWGLWSFADRAAR